MRVTKQPSGGRGEYELSEYAPSGLQPSDLLNQVLRLHLGQHAVDTQVALVRDEDQGKYRLRLVDDRSYYPHVHLQVAHALLMPTPRREERKAGGGEPVLQNGAYVIKNINFGEVTEGASGSIFDAEVLTVDAANQTIAAYQIPVLQRIGAIEFIWQSRGRFPVGIGALLEQHEKIVRASTPIPRTTARLVRELQREAETYSQEVGVSYTRTTDVVPALLAILGEEVPDLPVSIDQIEPEQIEVRRREIKRWQQWVARRGPASVRFRQEVRAAYGSRCIMCGNQFPPSKVSATGVDSAHILPWADYDLDHVSNGIALCKLHHWAFDEKILLIVYEDGLYYVKLSPDAEESLAGIDFSLDTLRSVEGLIPLDRLPARSSDHPNPDFLARWNSEST